jgi:hypothetical protein
VAISFIVELRKEFNLQSEKVYPINCEISSLEEKK